LHFATSLMAALLLAETGPAQGAFGLAYAGVLGFALVYLGEHYVIDLLAGAAIVIAVRRGERYVDPIAQAISRGLQSLERTANPGD
jgi:PAP2 superfamily